MTQHTTIARRGVYALVLSALAVAPAASAQILDADVNLDGAVRSTIDTATGTTLNATVTATGSAGTGTDDGRGDDKDFILRRSDLNGAGTTVIEPTTVTTRVEFEAYARSVMAGDENVTKVSASGDEVSVWYRENGRFLGFIPVTVPTRATVHADGEVEVSRPWYNFLTTTIDEDDIEADISSTAGTIARAEAEAEFSAATQARLVNALRSVMRSHFEAAAAAEVDTDANVNVNQD